MALSLRRHQPDSQVRRRQRVAKADKNTDCGLLRHLRKAVPDQVHIIRTDRAIGTPLVRVTRAGGIRFAKPPRNRTTISSRPMRFDMICEAKGIEHRLTKPTPHGRTLTVPPALATCMSGSSDKALKILWKAPAATQSRNRRQTEFHLPNTVNRHPNRPFGKPGSEIRSQGIPET